MPWYAGTLPSFGSGERTWSWRPEPGGDDVAPWPVLQSDWDGAVRFVPGWYTYAVDVGDGHLLVWRSRRSGAIELRLHRVEALASVTFSRPRSGERDLTSRRAVEVVSIPPLRGGVREGFASRTPIAHEELLLLTSMATTADGDPALAIVSWSPASGRVDVRPQTWFTPGSHDLGYEWVTRVARDPTTDRIVGEGVRIPPFELDDDGESVRRLLRS